MTLRAEAFHGPAGHIAKTYAPHTEADPAGILLALLTLAGNAIGPKPRVHIVAGYSHRLALQVVLVGDTATARKSTGANIAKHLVWHAADAPWQNRIFSTFTSAEALVAEVSQKVVDTETNETLGSTDPRLAVIVSEMATQLDAALRPQSGLFQALRLAWDGDPLSAMSRRARIRADVHHISLVGAITRSELRAKLPASEAAAGTVNRMLFCRVSRHNELPFGSTMPAEIQTELTSHLRRVIDAARPIGIIGYTDEVRKWWPAQYHQIVNRNGADPLAAHFAREDVQLVRLAAVYAALDGSSGITMPHMRAAQAVWDHSVDTVRWVWADPLQDRTVRSLLTTISETVPPGLKRGDAMRSLGLTASEMDRRLDPLEDAGLVCIHSVRTTTRGGPPAQMIYARGLCPFPTLHQTNGHKPMTPAEVATLGERARQQ